MKNIDLELYYEILLEQEAAEAIEQEIRVLEDFKAEGEDLEKELCIKKEQLRLRNKIYFFDIEEIKEEKEFIEDVKNYINFIEENEL